MKWHKVSDFLRLFTIIILPSPAGAFYRAPTGSKTTRAIIAGVVLCRSPIPFRSFMLPLHGESDAGLGAASSLHCWTVIMGRPIRLPACAQLMYYPTWVGISSSPSHCVDRMQPTGLLQLSPGSQTPWDTPPEVLCPYFLWLCCIAYHSAGSPDPSTADTQG